MPSFSIKQIAEMISADIIGDETAIITQLAPLYRAKSGELSFLANNTYRHYLVNTQASAVILTAENAKTCTTTALVVNNPELSFAQIAKLFVTTRKPSAGIHSSAIISPAASIPASASIGAHCVIGEHVVIGERTVLMPGVMVSDHVTIGKDCVIYSHVTLYHSVILHDRVILHSGCVIGADGFGLAFDDNHFEKIPQLGAVIIHNDVEIGANSCVDRGALDNTIIEEGVKIDNQVQIGHNVVIGAQSAIAGSVGIAGSARIGRHCMIGGATAIGGHLTICDGVILTGMSMVTKSVKEPGIYSSGTGLLPNKQWRKCVAKFRKLQRMNGGGAACDRVDYEKN